MKVSLIVLFTIGSFLTVRAQTPAADASVASPAAAPISTTSQDNARYVADPKLLAACTAQVTAFSGKPCDVIFIGDTAIAGWLTTGKAIWDKSFVPRKALDFGIVGDTTQNVLWRLSNMDVQGLKPKIAVIQIGGSNVANTAHEIADGVHAIVTTTQVTFPGVKIILVSPTPNDRDQDKMKQVNSLIRSNADDSTTFYLNLMALMPQVSTTNADGTAGTHWKGLDKDGVHLDATGYQIWADAMEPLMGKLSGP